VRTILSAVLGLLPWLLAQWVAFGVAGAGHGWVAPFFFSVPLAILYPVAFVRFFGGRRAAIRLDLGLLLVAAFLDLLLLANLFFQEGEYFLKVWNVAFWVVDLWLVLWTGWQLLLLARLLKDRRERPDA
jgi:hypothetical protein